MRPLADGIDIIQKFTINIILQYPYISPLRHSSIELVLLCLFFCVEPGVETWIPMEVKTSKLE